MTTVAMWLFSIPPSTASLERLFGAAGKVANKRKPRQAAKTTAKLLFAHGNVVRGYMGR